MTAKFYFVALTPPKPTMEQLELTFWMSVKDSTSAAMLGTYLERYPNGKGAGRGSFTAGVGSIPLAQLRKIGSAGWANGV
jgi:hypothetical protein